MTVGPIKVADLGFDLFGKVPQDGVGDFIQSDAPGDSLTARCRV
jgi:hypothetical protein